MRNGQELILLLCEKLYTTCTGSKSSISHTATTKAAQKKKNPSHQVAQGVSLLINTCSCTARAPKRERVYGTYPTRFLLPL
ncbi:MAG: hypothetical protein K0R47_246 [Brevibacillus sp.]|nr:hypothetical protein [Brevibacillus sp.]